MSKSKKKKNKKRAARRLNGMLSIISGLSDNKKLRQLISSEESLSSKASELLFTIRELFSERNDALEEFNSLLWEVASEQSNNVEDKILDVDVRLMGIEEGLVKAVQALSETSSSWRCSRFALCDGIRKAVEQESKNAKSAAES